MSDYTPRITWNAATARAAIGRARSISAESRKRIEMTLYIAENENVLTDFAELSEKYPHKDTVTLWEDAGGYVDGYRYFACSWCSKQYQYESGNQADRDRAEKEVNEHAQTCDKDPNALTIAAQAAEIARLRAVAWKLLTQVSIVANEKEFDATYLNGMPEDVQFLRAIEAEALAALSDGDTNQKEGTNE